MYTLIGLWFSCFQVSILIETFFHLISVAQVSRMHFLRPLYNKFIYINKTVIQNINASIKKNGIFKLNKILFHFPTLSQPNRLDPPPFIKIASALLSNNIHPIVILNSLQNTSFKVVDVLIALAIPISTSSSLSTKVLDNTALSFLPSLLMLSAFHLLFTTANLVSF